MNQSQANEKSGKKSSSPTNQPSKLIVSRDNNNNNNNNNTSLVLSPFLKHIIDDLWMRIFHFCNVDDFINSKLACKHFNRLGSCNNIEIRNYWRHQCKILLQKHKIQYFFEMIKNKQSSIDNKYICGKEFDFYLQLTSLVSKATADTSRKVSTLDIIAENDMLLLFQILFDQFLTIMKKLTDTDSGMDPDLMKFGHKCLVNLCLDKAIHYQSVNIFSYILSHQMNIYDDTINAPSLTEVPILLNHFLLAPFDNYKAIGINESIAMKSIFRYLCRFPMQSTETVITLMIRLELEKYDCKYEMMMEALFKCPYYQNNKDNINIACFINPFNNNGYSPLLLALSAGRTVAVRMLLKYFKDVKAVEYTADTSEMCIKCPIWFMAVAFNQNTDKNIADNMMEIAGLLLEYHQENMIPISMENILNCLIIIMKKGDIKMFELLLNYQEITWHDFRMFDQLLDFFCVYPLKINIFSRLIDCVSKSYICNKPKESRMYNDVYYQARLYILLELYRNHKFVKIMLEFFNSNSIFIPWDNQLPNAVTHKPLMTAAKRGWYDIVELIYQNMDSNMEINYGIINKQEKQQFIEKNVNFCDENGRNAYILACMKSNIKTIKLLIEKFNINVKVKDKQGNYGSHYFKIKKQSQKEFKNWLQCLEKSK